MNQFSPSPRVSHQDRFEFFAKIRGDIRKSRCTTGINHSGGKIAAGINDTGGKFATGINNTSFATSFASVVDTGGKYWEQYQTAETLKVHKIEIFFGFDFEMCIISLLVMSKY